MSPTRRVETPAKYRGRIRHRLLKAFLDTNVVLAAFLTPGVCHGLFQQVIAGEVGAVVSEQVLAETEEHLRDKFHVPDAERPRTLALVRSSCQVVPRPPDPPRISRDPDDNAIPAAAVVAGVTHLVTGDKDLLALDDPKRLRILKPADFVRHLAGQNKGS